MFVDIQSPLRYFLYLFMINNFVTYLGNSIFTCEMLETLPWVERRIVGSDGVILRTRVTGLRVLIWGLGVLLSYYSESIVESLNVAGSVFSPFVSYFGPVCLGLSSYIITTLSFGPETRTCHNRGERMI